MIRAPADDDLRFVRSAWLQSYATSDWARLVTPTDYWAEKRHGGASYFESQRATIELCIASAVVFVHEMDGLLDGFACGWPGTILHYVFVKWSRRGHGIARALLGMLDLREGASIIYTHRSAGVRGNPRGWRYDPSPSRFIGEGRMSELHRVKFCYFGETRSISLTKVDASGYTAKNQHTSFRAEEDRVVANFDKGTGLIYIDDLGYDKKPMQHVVSVHGVRDLVLYPPGEIPQWEREAKATAAAAKAKAEAEAKAKAAAAPPKPPA